MSKVKYNRVLLKISGEALAGKRGYGLDADVIKSVSEQIKEVREMGVQIAIVVGGGNMWRGKTGAELGMERSQAD